ncbi:hypothetical protein D3C84_934490 [compost metagenome]
MTGLTQLSIGAFQVGPGLFGQPQGFLKIQCRGGADLAALGYQFQRSHARLKSLSGKRQTSLCAITGQVDLGDFGHQGDLRAACRFCGCQVLFQCCVGQIAHSAEQIDLELTEPKSNLIIAVDLRVVWG